MAKHVGWERRLELGLVVAATAGLLLGCGAHEGVDARDEVGREESALRDRTRPTTPTNFRVTGKTPFSASLAWGPSSDNSGSFSYVLASTAGPSVTLPQTATTYTWAGLAPRNTYSFILYARDGAGNASGSVSVSAKLPADTVAPEPPVVSVTEVGPTYVSLAWPPAVDDGPWLFYEIWRDGALFGNAGTSTSYTAHFLEPGTSYAFSVRAYDYGPNYSQPSAPVAVTTAAPNPDDTTPPSTPPNLTADAWDDGEIHLTWSDSLDDFDPPSLIRYDVFVNGVLSDTLMGTSRKSIVYGDAGASNLVEVVASDTAGNASTPATLTVVIGG